MSDTLTELIPVLRLKLGDTNASAYRYLDAWLLTSLEAAVAALARYWDSKYLVDDAGVIYRNTNSVSYVYIENTEPPVIQFKDEWIIILMASIVVKSGQLENMAWSLGNWRDAELSFSNIESGKQKDGSLQRDLDELAHYLKAPIKRPVFPIRTSYTEPT